MENAVKRKVNSFLSVSIQFQYQSKQKHLNSQSNKPKLFF